MLYKDAFRIFIKKLLPSGIFAVIFFSAFIAFAASNLSKPVTSSLVTPIHPNILELVSIYKAYVLPDGFGNPSTTTVSGLTSIYKNYINQGASTSAVSSDTAHPVKVDVNIPPIIKTAQATPTILELTAFYKNYITQVQTTTSTTPVLPDTTSH